MNIFARVLLAMLVYGVVDVRGGGGIERNIDMFSRPALTPVCTQSVASRLCVSLSHLPLVVHSVVVDSRK